MEGGHHAGRPDPDHGDPCPPLQIMEHLRHIPAAPSVAFHERAPDTLGMDDLQAGGGGGKGKGKACCFNGTDEPGSLGTPT